MKNMNKGLLKNVIKFLKPQSIITNSLMKISNFRFMDKLSNLRQVDNESNDPLNISLNNDYKDYFKMISLTKELSKIFSHEKFEVVINFLSENSYFNNSNLIKDFESIYIKNIDNIEGDLMKKSIVYLSKKVISETIEFDDNNWEIIFNTFTKLKFLTTDCYFHTLNSLNLLNKHLNSKLDKSKADISQFLSKYQVFLVRDNSRLFNNIVVINSLEDIFILSKLFHNKTLHLSYVSDHQISQINHVIKENKSKLNIKISVVIPCIMILHQEQAGRIKTSILFKDAIPIMNNHLFFLFNNYDFLEEHDRSMIDNLSDSLLFYSYLHFKPNDFKQIFNKLINSYFNRIKHDENINWLSELRLLMIISNECDYKDYSFWNEVFVQLRLFVLTDFEASIRKIYKNHIKSITDSKGYNNTHQITGLLYIGVMVELASSVPIDIKHWEFIIDTLKRNTNFKQKDIFYNLQFIFIHCHKLYQSKSLTFVWKQMTEIFNTKIKRILNEERALSFFISSIFENKAVDPNDLSGIMTLLFLQNQIEKDEGKDIREESKELKDNEVRESKNNNIELFCVIFELLDRSFAKNNTITNIKIMGNTFVDLLKLESSLFTGQKVKLLLERMKISEMDLFRETVYDRVIMYVKEDIESNQTSMMKVIITLSKSNILSQIDLSKILFILNKRDEEARVKNMESLIKSLLNSK